MTKLPPPPEALIDKFVARMHKHIPDMNDHKAIARWAIDFASNAYQDGFLKGQQDTLMGLVKEFMKEESDAADIIALLQLLYPRGSGGASRSGAGPTPPGSTGVPAGEGSEAGEGAQPRDASVADDIRATGESTVKARKGDVQS